MGIIKCVCNWAAVDFLCVDPVVEVNSIFSLLGFSGNSLSDLGEFWQEVTVWVFQFRICYGCRCWCWPGPVWSTSHIPDISCAGWDSHIAVCVDFGHEILDHLDELVEVCHTGHVEFLEWSDFVAVFIYCWVVNYL